VSISKGDVNVTRRSRLVMQMVLAALVVAPVACSLPARPMAFNNMMARANQRLNEEAKKFNKAVSPLGSNAAADTAAAQSAYNSIQTTLQDLKKEFDNVRPPLGSEAGSTMLQKYQEFLQTEQSIFDTCLTPAVQALQDNARYPDAASKWAVIGPLLTKAGQMERPVLDSLGAAQKAYTESYKFEAK
jgi:hypothetical protein